MGQGAAKICVICGQDCSGRPRTKDARGRYYCNACVDRVRRMRKSASGTGTAIDLDPEATDVDMPGPAMDVLDEAPASAPKSETAPARCPSCREYIENWTVVCPHCQYNLRTGRREEAPPPPEFVLQRGGAGFISAFVNPAGVSVILLLMFFSLFAVAEEHPALFKGAYVGVALVYFATMTIVVTAAGFRESPLHGLMCLFLPPYALYFVLVVMNHDYLKALYVVMLAAVVLGLFLPGVLEGDFGFR